MSRRTKAIATIEDGTRTDRWFRDVEARLARHDERLADHESRIGATERQCSVLDAHMADYAYELDMLTRMALRSARRIDRLDRPAISEDAPTEPRRRVKR